MSFGEICSLASVGWAFQNKYKVVLGLQLEIGSVVKMHEPETMEFTHRKILLWEDKTKNGKCNHNFREKPHSSRIQEEVSQ